MGFDPPPGTVAARGFDWDDVRFPARTVGQFVRLKYGKALQESKRRAGDVPVFGTNGQCGWHNEPLTHGPGVILGRKGQGHLGVKWCNEPFWVIDTAYYADIDGTQADLRWFYFLTEYVGLDHLKTGEKPGLPRELFCRQLFPFPRMDEQKAIARVLGVLDDKIELNRRMNETLETLARAMFKSWFVDFDPVVAKAAGKKPVGMSAQTAALFPDRFQDSALGPIPNGWTPSSVAGIARYVNGRNFTKNAVGSGRMVIRIAELNSGVGGSTVFNDVKAARENVAMPDDILFAWSGSLDVYRWHGDEALVNQHIFNVVTDSLPKWFVYYHLREAISFFQGIAADKATTMGHIKREHLSQAELAMPPRTLISAADRMIRPLYDRVHRLERQNRSLAALRDALLPQLMSGELRVRQAEKLVAQAV